MNQAGQSQFDRTLGVIFGSNLYVQQITADLHTVLEWENEQGSVQEVFRLRELFRERSTGSYLVIDCDLRDRDGNREVKLAKNRPVKISDELCVQQCDKDGLIILREDGTIVIQVEVLHPDSITQWFPKMRLRKTLEKLIRLNGTFNVGPYTVDAQTGGIEINGQSLSGIFFVGNVNYGGKMRLTPNGLSF